MAQFSLCPLLSISTRLASRSARLARRVAWLVGLLLGLTEWGAAQALPPALEAALVRAKVPRDALSLVVVDVQPGATPLWSHQAQLPMNPASVMKLVTTTAALDRLGPAFTWTTPVYVDGTVRDGTLTGQLWIQGQGDPRLVLERLWLLLRRVQGLGIAHIVGDIVLDNTAFAPPPVLPGEFDGEPLRPYNASPDALLINFKSVVLTITPDPTQGFARLQWDPPLAGVHMPERAPLREGECNDYRGALKADFSDPLRFRIEGTYPTSCGEKVWPVAYADPNQFAARAVHGLWTQMGGRLQGRVRYAALPAQARDWQPAFVLRSPTLAEVVRDINKFSNNVMAQQLFLTLARESGSVSADLPRARAQVSSWWQQRLGGNDGPVLDNGSGLSRSQRISASALARLLLWSYASPLMPDLLASLPMGGVDGTLRRAPTLSQGGAHLKTGSLTDVTALAGYIHAHSGKRFVFVTIVNHPQARQLRPALDALVESVTRL